MKKLIILVISCFLSSLAFAQEVTCLDKLLPLNRSSGLHQVLKDEWYDGKEIIDADSTKNAFTYLINSKLLCKNTDVVIKVFPVCTLTVADLPQSNSCFMYTNLGYFVVTRDNGKNTNFIFSKDKRFADQADETSR